MYAACEARRVFVISVDDPASCSAFSMAVVRRGPVTVAIGTGGKAPALSKLLRRWLDASLPRELGAWACPLPTIDPQIVIRSARALPEYGPDFQYGHYAEVRSLATLAAGARGAKLTGAGGGGSLLVLPADDPVPLLDAFRIYTPLAVEVQP